MRIALLGAVPAFVATLILFGCGTVDETTQEYTEQEESPPPAVVAPPQIAILEYRIDSLAADNRRLRQQVEAMAAENRGLAARNAEMEMRLNEALAKAKPEPVVKAKPEPVAKMKSPPAPPPADMTASYSGALAEYRKRNFAAAAAQFGALISTGIREDLEDNCYYWIGESMYGLGRYQDALENFQTVFTFTRSDKRDDAQMMIGNCYIAMRNAASARKALSTLVDNYPTSPYLRRAQEKLALIK
jgi:TolA-binding protein